MAGVENITAAILKEARDTAAAIINDAEKKAEEAENTARGSAGKLLAEAEQAAARNTEAYRERTKSRKDLMARQEILKTKQELIEGIIDKAYEKLKGLDRDEYFGMIETLLKKSVQEGRGFVMFSEDDLKRLPAGFEDRIDEIARAAGGDLELSDTPADIESGFILRYGGIDYNCSLSSVFHEKRSEMQDAARDALFG